MTNQSRRDAFKTLLAGAGLGMAPGIAPAADCASTPTVARQWRRGVEGQRQADQGDGTYINPIIAGCLLYTSPSPRDQRGSRMPSSA